MELEFENDLIIKCSECGNHMQYVIRAYEYHTGVLNYDDYESKGCSFVQEPSIEVNYFGFEIISNGIQKMIDIL